MEWNDKHTHRCRKQSGSVEAMYDMAMLYRVKHYQIFVLVIDFAVHIVQRQIFQNWAPLDSKINPSFKGI